MMLFAMSLISGASAEEKPVFTVQIADQFERSHTAKTLFEKGRPVIFVGGDRRKTRDEIQPWLKPLREALKQRVKLVGYVDLRELPFFIPNGSVRKGLKTKYPQLSILCDFKGQIASKLGFTRKTAIQLRVFDGNGTVMGGVRGSYSAERLAKVVALLNKN
jgi:hypothetical protein